MSLRDRRMNPRVKDLWLEALRSGKYKQGRSRLSKNGKYCCLGVLCEVAVKDGVGLVVEEVGSAKEIAYNGCTTVPPLEVMEWAGLSEQNPLIDPPNDIASGSLASENDRGATFEQIADIIEEQF